MLAGFHNRNIKTWDVLTKWWLYWLKAQWHLIHEITWPVCVHSLFSVHRYEKDSNVVDYCKVVPPSNKKLNEEINLFLVNQVSSWLGLCAESQNLSQNINNNHNKNRLDSTQLEDFGIQFLNLLQLNDEIGECLTKPNRQQVWGKEVCSRDKSIKEAKLLNLYYFLISLLLVSKIIEVKQCLDS